MSALAEVYSVGSLENPYAVLEWHGGVSLADRLRAGETLAVQDFLAGGSQLASGLAALHASGSIHGAVDTAAIGFAGNHSAKLGSFGRRARYEHTSEDTAALASALRIAISGIDIPGIRPSEVAEGLPHDVDAILAAAENKTLSAEALAASAESSASDRNERAALLVVLAMDRYLGRPDAERPSLCPRPGSRSTSIRHHRFSFLRCPQRMDCLRRSSHRRRRPRSREPSSRRPQASTLSAEPSRTPTTLY